MWTNTLWGIVSPSESPFRKEFIMCRPATCRQCGKVTWAGCGQHVDEMMAGVPRDQQCTCAPEDKQSSGRSFWSAITGR